MRDGLSFFFEAAALLLESAMPRESADAFIQRNSIKPTFAELLEGCCKDLPDSLTPYLLCKLRERFPAAANTVEIPVEALAWKSADVKVYNKVQLGQFIEDLRWAPTSAALLERVLYERPRNVPAFLIELLAKGDLGAPDTGEVAAQDALDAAAAKVQAIQRGHMTRKERKEQDKAAAKVQAAKRGQAGRKAAANERQRVQEEQGAAATKMQARQRGRNQRKKVAEVEHQGAADASEQADNAEAELREQQEEADAMAYLSSDPSAAASATKMQAIQRGRQARRK